MYFWSQIYHAEFDQKIVSVKNEGNDCCWILFEDNFFVGETERICGDANKDLRMKNNVKSILKVDRG